MQKRKPVDVMSFVKSPYGLMIVFSLFIIVVLPKLKVSGGDDDASPVTSVETAVLLWLSTSMQPCHGLGVPCGLGGTCH